MIIFFAKNLSNAQLYYIKRPKCDLTQMYTVKKNLQVCLHFINYSV